MNVEWISRVAVVAADPAKSRELYADGLGLPLQPDAGGEYLHHDRLGTSSTSTTGRPHEPRTRILVPFT